MVAARQGFAPDHRFLEESRRIIQGCVDRTWPLFEKGAGLLGQLRPRTRSFVELFVAGGQRVLRLIELWNYETALHRPRLSKARKSMLIGRAWLRARLPGRAGSLRS